MNDSVPCDTGMSTRSDTSGFGPAPQALANLLAAFGPAYKRWAQARLGNREVGYTHIRALHLLRCHGPQIMSGLGDGLGITPRYVTSLVDHLEQDGLVRRRQHPQDRRATLIELTDAGRQTCGMVSERHVDAAVELLQVLTPEQQQDLLDALKTLLCELQRRGFTHDPQPLLDDGVRAAPAASEA